MEDEHHSSPRDGVSSRPDEAIAIPGEGELRQFFERLRSRGKVTVQDGNERFLIQLSQTQISDKARAFLALGGPVSND